MVLQQEIRKGPWTEQEDFKLAYFVGMFGDRRWDFIAKVSGLSRTGKSCRLRWVNYLHPDLKRGKMTPQEERLVLELHSKWGNRWSRIARKLPGRTDNEIKNYWRTYMRKKRAQEKKRASAAASAADSHASSTCQSSSLSSNTNTDNSNNNNPAAVDSHASKEAGEESFYDTGGPNMIGHAELQGYSMDDIWKDIAMSEDHGINNINLQPVEVYEGHSEEGCNFSCPPLMPSPPSWDYNYYSSDPLWVMDIEEESKMLFPTIGGGGGDQYYDQQACTAFLTG